MGSHGSGRSSRASRVSRASDRGATSTLTAAHLSLEGPPFGASRALRHSCSSPVSSIALSRGYRRRAPSAAAMALLAVLLVVGARPTSAQSGSVQLFAGDSIRIDGSTIASVVTLEGTRLTTARRAKPRCRAGERHGEAPICDPAPLIREEVDIGRALIEKRAAKGNVNRRTLVGGVVGSAAFAAFGYVLGPAVGFGKVAQWECLEIENPIACPSGPVSRDEYESIQRAQDQKRGALFFGAIGGSAVAIFTRKLSVGWVRIDPVIPVSSSDPWGVNLSVPGRR